MEPYAINDLGALIKDNPYVGRGIVIGKSADGKKAVFAYFIMGRSENSRNRVFLESGDDVVIHPFDPSKVADPSLIIYSPVRVLGSRIIVTNGDQTDTVYDYMKNGKGFSEALETRTFEPDGPNFTPRISGLLDFTNFNYTYQMSILKANSASGDGCNRFTFSYTPVDGLGHFIHTYATDGNPIPTFCGEPERVSIPNDIALFTDTLWTNLNAQNRVSLYVRYIDLATRKVENRMINKNS